MIGFFRQIRKKLADDNQFIKYSRYAIGEILLVVIGILIALQVNNWNENRKLRAKEIKILIDLKSDITENIDNLNEGIERLEIANDDISQVLVMCEQKISYSDSLLPAFTNLFSQWDPDFTYAGFENLKSLGVNIISNPGLRKKIINHIEIEMDILDNADMNRINQLNSVLVLPMIQKYFYRDLGNQDEYPPMIPSNYKAMINDAEFYNVCTEVSYKQRRAILRFMNFIDSANNLIIKINAEIQPATNSQQPKS